MDKKKIAVIVLSVLLAVSGFLFGSDVKESVCECEKQCQSKTE